MKNIDETQLLTELADIAKMVNQLHKEVVHNDTVNMQLITKIAKRVEKIQKELTI